MPDDIRLNILRILTEEPDISQREIARRLGVSLGKANYCLRALVEKGWVKATNFRNSKCKIAYLYILTPDGMEKKAELTAKFLQCKMAEYDAIKLEINRLQKEVYGESRLLAGEIEEGD